MLPTCGFHVGSSEHQTGGLDCDAYSLRTDPLTSFSPMSGEDIFVRQGRTVEAYGGQEGGQRCH